MRGKFGTKLRFDGSTADYKEQYTMITLKIKNAELERQLLEFIKIQKRDLETVAIEAIQNFINVWQEKPLNYPKKDVNKHVHLIQKNCDEPLNEIKPYRHVKDSASYIKKLRSQSYET